MAGINKVIVVGRLGNDPEVRYMPSGGAVTNISVATSDSWTDKNSGQRQERTEWHRVTLFNKLGEIAGEYLKKGSQVYIEGRLQTRKWQDNNGNDRYSTDIIANEMQMLGGRNDSGGTANFGNNQQGQQQNQYQNNNQNQNQAPQQNNNQNQAPQQQNQQSAPMAGPDDFDDEIPF